MPSSSDPLVRSVPMKRSTVEDCLEALHSLGAADEPVPPRAIARWLGVTVELGALMIDQLAALTLIERDATGGILLTPHGRQEATGAVRRRRLIESVLMATYDYPIDAAQTIAARLAHAVAAELVARAALVFGEPDLTPRAEPAPAWALAMRAELARSGEEAAGLREAERVAFTMEEASAGSAWTPFRRPALPLARGESNA